MLSTASVMAEREQACNACAKKVVIFGVDTCAECGCILRAKIHVAAAECPRARWVHIQKDQK